jgi:hypothetical protein
VQLLIVAERKGFKPVGRAKPSLTRSGSTFMGGKTGEKTGPSAISEDAKPAFKEWAKAEGVSVNAIVVSVLEEFFKRLKKGKALREELRLEIRAHRGFMPS